MKLVLEKILVQLNETTVLHDVTLEVREGEILGLIGPNGSGKTTLLTIILGVYKHKQGHMYLCDTCIDDLEIYDRGVAGILLVPQSLHQFWMAWHPLFCGFVPGMTVFENVDQVLHSHREVEKWIKVFDLDSSKNKKPAHLSWGQQQRLALVRMCAFKPKVLLLDEPFAATDWKVKKELKTYIRQYLKRNRIITIYTASDPAETKGFCDRIALIKNGTIKTFVPHRRSSSKNARARKTYEK
ncbi:MAG: ABC transporter ATP-binding protein [Candidatus Omnitrophota bacterium]